MPLEPTRAAAARILVIDDDAERSASLRRLLSDERFQLADLMANSGPVDLVIATIAPGISPRIAAAEIARLSGTAPVLALVDRAQWIGFDFFDVADALSAAAVLQRPFPRAALRRSIAAVLSRFPGGRMAENSWPPLQSESTEFFLEDSRFA